MADEVNVSQTGALSPLFENTGQPNNVVKYQATRSSSGLKVRQTGPSLKGHNPQILAMPRKEKTMSSGAARSQTVEV